MYSFSTRDVVISKTSSAEWAKKKFSQWTPIILSAMKRYEGSETTSSPGLLAGQISDFCQFSLTWMKDHAV